MSVTLNDIAARVQCSPATVSRAMNGTASVEETLRVRILAAMEELETQANGDKAESKKGRPRGSVSLSDTIDVVLFRNEGLEPLCYSDQGLKVASITDEDPHAFFSPRLKLSTDFYRSIIDGIIEELYKVGLQMRQQICRDLLDERFINRLNKSRHRGVLLLGSPDKTVKDFIHRCSLPVVLVDILGIPDVPVVAVDNLGGITLALRHLLSLGHKRIGFAGNNDNPGLQIRYLAFCGGMTGAGLVVKQDWCLLAAEHIKDVVKKYTKILSSPNRPSAVICANDCYAIGVMSAAAAAGLSIPKDLSVVGFDDVDVAALLTPPLTTVRVPKTEIGACAADLLLHCTGNGGLLGLWNHCEVRCRTELVVRGSTRHQHD